MAGKPWKYRTAEQLEIKAQLAKQDHHAKENKTITIRAKAEWIQRVDAVAAHNNMSRMAYIRAAVDRAMEDSREG